MATTTAKGLRIPQIADNNAVVTDFTNLATDLDTYMGGFTTTQRNALTTAQKWDGRLIYNTTTRQLETYNLALTQWELEGAPGECRMWFDDVAPVGWVFPFGQAVNRIANAALFALIGTTYGIGDGSTTFNLPDCRGRTFFALDNMGGSDANRLAVANTLGLTGGNETTTLTGTELPVHSHTSAAHTHTISHTHSTATTSTAPDHQHAGISGSYPMMTTSMGATATGGPSVPNLNSIQANTAAAGSHNHTVDVPTHTGSSGSTTPADTGTAGTGSAFSNMPPYMLINYVMKLG